MQLAARFALLALATPIAHAQTIDRVVPQMGAPGDVVLIEGTGLAGTTGVGVELFIAPGFPTFVAPDSVTDTQVWFTVPVLTLDPGQSSSVGAVYLQTSPLTFAGSFFPLQQTLGDMVTLGQGTTPSASTARPAFGFDFSAGPPKFLIGQPFGPDVWNNNAAFTPTLHFAPPAAATFLAVGAPDFGTAVPIGDGTIALDGSLPFLLLTTSTDLDGGASLPLPVPASLTGTVALQWFTVDPGLPSLVAASNGFVTVF